MKSKKIILIIPVLASITLPLISAACTSKISKITPISDETNSEENEKKLIDKKADSVVLKIEQINTKLPSEIKNEDIKIVDGNDTYLLDIISMEPSNNNTLVVKFKLVSKTNKKIISKEVQKILSGFKVVDKGKSESEKPTDEENKEKAAKKLIDEKVKMISLGVDRIETKLPSEIRKEDIKILNDDGTYNLNVKNLEPKEQNTLVVTFNLISKTNSKIVSEEATRTLSGFKVVETVVNDPKMKPDVPKDSEMNPSEPETNPSNPKMNPSEPSNPETNPSNPETNPSNPKTNPSEPSDPKMNPVEPSEPNTGDTTEAPEESSPEKDIIDAIADRVTFEVKNANTKGASEVKKEELVPVDLEEGYDVEIISLEAAEQDTLLRVSFKLISKTNSELVSENVEVTISGFKMKKVVEEKPQIDPVRVQESYDKALAISKKGALWKPHFRPKAENFVLVDVSLVLEGIDRANDKNFDVTAKNKYNVTIAKDSVGKLDVAYVVAISYDNQSNLTILTDRTISPLDYEIWSSQKSTATTYEQNSIRMEVKNRTAIIYYRLYNKVTKQVSEEFVQTTNF